MRVRRHRVQMSVRVTLLPSWTLSCCRLTRYRRRARTRFIPVDWGLKPPMEVLPHEVQERAMTIPLGFRVSHEACDRIADRTAAYYTIGPARTDEAVAEGRRLAVMGRMRWRSCPP